MDMGDDADDYDHIESHAGLVDFSARCGVDRVASDATEEANVINGINAVIVPTIRPGHLSAATRVVQRVGGTLMVLCSTSEQAARALKEVCDLPIDSVFIFAVSHSYQHDLLHFMTSLHPELEVEPSCHADIARKRNLGLLIARLSGWRTVLYLDDDIHGMTKDDLALAIKLVTRFQAVGFEVSHYPDNSVVCHANRLAGGKQDIFPGGSALLVDVNKSTGFFPYIYNEDWLFLFDSVRQRSVAVAGTAAQLEYQPFARASRAASEEFGDLIAEGLYRLIHEGVDVEAATLGYWQDALKRRSRFIDDVARRLLDTRDCMPAIDSALMSLTAAKKRLASISPLACVSFVRAWRMDLDAWGQRLDALSALGGPSDAADFLRLGVPGGCVTK